MLVSDQTAFAGLTGDQVDIVEPATGKVIGSTLLAGAEDVAAAVTRSVAAQPKWADTAPAERAEILLRAAQLIHDHEDEFVHWGIRECGAIAGKTTHEVHSARGELIAAAALATEPYGQLLPSTGRMSYGRRIPFGAVGVIAPWNFPLVLAMRAVAPALALGNSVLLKPDHQTPIYGGLLIARLFEAAGLPAGLLEVLPGKADAGQALVADPRVPMISFTGSTRAGKIVAATAAEHVKKVSLELGGNNATIVLADADLDAASSVGAWGSFLHQGQICLTTGRHLVQRKVADEYLDRLAARAARLKVGDPADADTQIGPIINATQLANVDRIVRASASAGASVRAGGTHENLFYAPTVLADVTPEMPAFTDEIFGPVAPVTVFDTEDEAVALANATAYGLTASVLTAEPFRGWKLAERLRAGMVHVNDTTVNDDPTVPFGGVGASGNGGRYGGQANWEEFTQWQWVTVRDTPPAYPF
ncbi:benzaldehyde dehydrogenase [Kutzneria sp. NPDC052558]|uniref:benzaldehyde dehydrogenase n=1 Tax=Kutzneria sp. NPDC052558 TaxID=3364121 RepID=UPI0037C5FBC1